MISVSKVGTEYIPTIQNLAERTWKVAYTSIITPEQMSYMLEMFYSETSLLKQMQDGHQFIIAKDRYDPVGFASYSPKSADLPTIYRLHKIYIAPGHQGKGIGKLMIGYIVNDIGFYNATDLELNVNRHNKALHFYETLGFKIIKEEDIDIGSGYFMNDYVLNLSL